MPPMFRCIDGECDCQQMGGAWRERTDEAATDAMRLASLPEAERNRAFREIQVTNPALVSIAADDFVSD